MPKPVGSPSSSTAGLVDLPEVPAHQLDTLATAPPSASTPTRSAEGTSVEPWRGEPMPSTGESQQHSGPVSSGRDLSAQAAQEARARRTAMKALGELEGPIAELAAKFQSPISFFGNVEFRLRDVAFGHFGDALRAPQFSDAAGQLSPADVRNAIGALVKKAWPQCSAKDTERLKEYFMGQVAESLSERAAPRMQALAAKMLGDAGQSFEQTATDASAVRALAEKLTSMADPMADPEAQAAVRDLRAGLGLDPDTARVSAEELGRALRERAALLRREATAMSHHARPTLLRALAEHDVGPLFKAAQGVREGSLLAAQIDAIRERGESEKTTLHYVKLASVVAAAGVTGGLSLGAGIGLGVSTSMAAPSVLQGWVAVGGAKAGESAGTMKPGSGEAAHRRAVIESGAAALSVLGSAAGSGALHGMTEALAKPAAMHMADGIVKGLVHGAIEGAMEEATHQGGHLLDRAFDSEGRAPGKDALQRAADERP